MAKVSLPVAFDRAIKRNPKASRKESFDYFLETVQSDPNYLVALAEYYFDAKYADVKVVEVSPGRHETQFAGHKREQYEARKAKREEGKNLVQEEVRRFEKRLRDIFLMGQMMPNGKLRRDCTGAELVKCGGFDEAVGKAIGAGRKVCGRELTEDALHNIRERYFKDTAAPAAGKRRATARVAREDRVSM